jgi:Protein of unknown function (DUF3306)
VNEGFLSRWSRVKRETDAGVAPVVPTEPLPVPAPVQPVVAEASTSEVVAALPSIESVSLEADFTPFMQSKVPDAIRRQAVKQLFKDPHFNKMDGLDVYIDDYNTFTPIPEDWYKDIPSWQKILNPPQPLDTGKGYFVDSDTEEGKAILAERAKAEAAAAEPADPDAAPTEPLAITATEQTVIETVPASVTPAPI